jgi:predicted nucleotidyltransferase component of viral defense system
MDRVAALTDKERSELFEQTANVKGVHPAIIEKDFWVCWILKKLFGSQQLADQLVFKGGTSLSKVYQLIDRFSEDIDLVLNWELLGYGKGRQNPWEEQASNTQQHRFNKEFNNRAQAYIEKTLCPLVKTLVASCPGVVPIVSTLEPQVVDIQYPAAFALDALRPQVKLEIGPLASWVPSAKHVIQPYAAEEFGKVFDDPECPVVALKAERTFWEKATILHQQAHRATPIPPGYSRHYYDLFQLANSPVKKDAFNDLQLLKDVVRFKCFFYRCSWAKYEDAKPGTFRLMTSTAGSIQLDTDYRATQVMIFSRPPPWSEINETLSALENQINELPREVKI